MSNFQDLDKRILSPIYYLNNFKKLLKFVEVNYSDLLKKNELKIIDEFNKLPRNSKLLYVRLISRKGPFFIIEKLTYDEIEISKALKGLLSCKFCQYYESSKDIEKEYYIEDYLSVYTRKELETILVKAGYKGFSSYKRIDLVEIFLDNANLREELLKYFPILTLNKTEEFQLFFYLFFGNFNQTLSDFILEDIGALKYERYQIDKETRLFDSRNSINKSRKFHLAREVCYICMERGDLSEALELLKVMGRNKGKRYSLNRKFRDYSDLLGRHFERHHFFDQALKCYSKSNSSYARERSVRIFVKLGEITKAAKILKRMAKSPQNFDERDFVRKFGKKLSKLTTVDYTFQTDWKYPEEKWQIKKISSLKVEDMIVKELKKKRLKALHSENWFWNSLLGLAFWDIIFKPIPGVFHHPFQRGPLDLFQSEDFYSARKELIEARLRSIKSGRYKMQILKTAKKKYKTANYLVNWNTLDLDFLKIFLENFPTFQTEAILRRQLSELRQNSSGLPDILCFDKKGEPKFYEVKGPGDQLRPNQKAWLSYMNELGINCSVLWISYK